MVSVRQTQLYFIHRITYTVDDRMEKYGSFFIFISK